MRAFLHKRVGASENTKKVMEQWSEMGLRVFRNGFGKRKRSLKVTVDEATCRTMGEVFGGASEKQKVQPLEILRQCHVDRY